MSKEKTGTIIERNGKFLARVRFTDENGNQREISRITKTKAEARKKLRILLNDIETFSTKQLDSLNMTFSELAEHYIKNYLQEAVYVSGKKVAGVRGVEPALYAVKPLVNYFGSRKIRTITYGDLRNFRQLRFTVPTKHGTQRNIATVNKELSKLKRMFNIAVREQWLSRNPFNNGESLIGEEIHRNRILTLEEEVRLFKAIASKQKREHLKGIVLIALDCALRRGEIFKLCWSEVDFQRRTITVTAFNSKTAREKTVAMTKRVFAELQNLRLETDNDKSKLVFGINVTIKTSWEKDLQGSEDFRFSISRLQTYGNLKND